MLQVKQAGRRFQGCFEDRRREKGNVRDSLRNFGKYRKCTASVSVDGVEGERARYKRNVVPAEHIVGLSKDVCGLL